MESCLGRGEGGGLFTNAGIGSTCSNTGAFRLDRDVFRHGPVDLLFVEFAVNDDQDGHFTRTEAIRGMEGIIRHARLSNPQVDIVMSFLVNERMIHLIQRGEVPISIAAHAEVAKHYQVPTISVAQEVTDQITAGTLTFERYGGVHPGPVGQALCARMVDELFRRCWSTPLPATARIDTYELPADPLDAMSYFSGHFLDVRQATLRTGWTIGIPDWDHLPGKARFKTIPMLCATEPGAEVALSFEGTAIGAYLVAGPDAGIVEVSIDGAPARTINLVTGWSANLHYPCTVMLGTDLKPGRHAMTLRMTGATTTGGHAMRIMEFCVN